MANKYNMNTVSPLSKVPPQIFSNYKLAGGGNTIIAVGTAGVEWLNNGADEARKINTAARNVNAPIDQFSQISGAMRIRGVEQMAAIKSTEQLYSNLNNMLWGHNDQGLAQLHEYGFDIISNENGTVDATATIAKIAEDFPQMAPQVQSKLTDALKIDGNTIELLREGAQLKDLLAKSTLFGLTIDPELNIQLTELDQNTDELSAAWDGLKDKLSNIGYEILVSDGSVADGIGGVTDTLTYGPDNFAIMRTLGIISGNDSAKMRWAYNNTDFKKQLNWYEITMLNSGLMTDGFRKKYQDHIKLNDAEKINYQTENAGVISGLRPIKIESTPLTDLFNLGSGAEVETQTQTQNTWSNNRITEFGAEDPYSLSPSSSLAPDNNIGSIPTAESPIYTDSAGGFNANAIADVIATAMQNNRVQIELTLIDSRSGESLVIPTQGGSRIAHAMQM